MKKRFTEEQIIGFLREVEAGVTVKDLCGRKGFSPESFYQWRAKFGGMSVSEAKRLESPIHSRTELADSGRRREAHAAGGAVYAEF